MYAFTCVAALVHAVFLISIFDIYFKSPIIPNVSVIKNQHPPLAKRLVLLISDGLRADKFLEPVSSPYLRNKILREGIWGISKAHIPTESRPGHVSIIAGIYEDPSAVFKGWKHNPVDFDSVFNQTDQTFAWGSPDILNIFNKGNESCGIDSKLLDLQFRDRKCRIYTDTYDPEFQDISGSNNSASELNIWVLKKFVSFFEMAKSNQILGNLIRGEKIIFFLHLLGTDVSGHVNKPNSLEYMTNIKIADEIVREVASIISSFYGDNNTAFIYTSDHGMSDWGSHGAGSLSETETPIVAWGSGITTPGEPSLNSFRDWGLPSISRHDINQSDIAPLMSTLLGISIPANSIGILPINYLNATPKEKASLLYLNARQIENQYNLKRDEIKGSVFDWMFYEYPDMTREKQNSLHNFINEHYSDNNVSIQINYITDLINYTIAGIEYYHKFHQYFLCALITLSYLGWILFISVSLLSEKTYKTELKAGKGLNITFFLLGCCLSVFVGVQAFPILIHLYIWVTISVWWAFATSLGNLTLNLTSVKKHLLQIIWHCALCLLGVESLVLAFFKREILSLIMMFLLIWPVRNPNTHKHKLFLAVWMLSCLLLAVFPFLPTVGFNKNAHYVLLCGVFWLIGGIVLLSVKSVTPTLNTKVHCAILFKIFVAIINIYFIPHMTGPYLTISYTISWFILFLSLLLLNFGPVNIYVRYFHIILALCAPYLLLSIGHEVFFTLILSMNLLCWIYFEHQLSYDAVPVCLPVFPHEYGITHPVSSDDLRRSFFFLFYIFFSFFGIGNIASINSFDISWVQCFISVFSPFTMTGLILSKTLIPFLIVAVAFRMIKVLTKANTGRLFLMVLIMCDIMGLNFFFRVTNKGSWLDIGLSISHYVIVHVIVLFLVVVYNIATFITKPHLKNNHFGHNMIAHQIPALLKKHGD